MSNNLNAEIEATRMLADLLELAKKCEQSYAHANMSLPEPLKRVLGINANGIPASPQVVIPPPTPPRMPAEAQSDWIWVPVEDASVTSVVLATLRTAKEPVRAKDVAALVNSIMPNVPSGSIFNVGAKLHGKKILRSDDGWTLIKPEYGGIISDKFLWGPKEIFQKTELAAHRREAIIHLLTVFKSGLQTRQIVDNLHKCPWVHAPINKDLLKADLEILAAKDAVKRQGNSKKWILVPKDGAAI